MTEVRVTSERRAATEVRILPEIIANKIAAGEVVERPASVVKELVENSLDAGAKRISIEIQKGGSDLIRVSDDGYGMSRDNACLSIQRHATSKIVSDEDIFSIKTFGFRGEALPSIASVSQFTLITRDSDSQSGTRIDISGGNLMDVSETGAPIGTMIEVKNLYFNTPARRKFLKTVNTEMGHIADAVSAFALASPKVQFRLVHNGRNGKHFSESDDLLSRVSMVLGTDSINDLYSVSSDETRTTHLSTERGVYINGYITKPSISRNTSGNILIFVNKRLISDRNIVSAILRGYKGRLMKGQFPMAALFIEIPFDQVDVNVHPAKLQVRFANQSLVFGSVVNAVHNTLYHCEKGDVNLDHSEANKVEQNSHTLEFDNAKEELSEKEQRYRNFNHYTSTIHESLSLDEVAHSRDIEISEPLLERFTPDLDLVTADVKQTSPCSSDQKFESDSSLSKADYFVNPILKHNPISESRKYPETETGGDIKGLRIIGQFANTYIIAESYNKNRSKYQIVIIDQHAAHERVVYERLKKRSEGFKPPAQDLIVPEIIEFNYKEAALLERIILQLVKVGIEIEPFGGTSFVVKSVPAIIDDKSVRHILRDMVGMMVVSDTHHTLETDAWLDRILILMSCHSAVRANHPLNPKEMEQLLADLAKCENPYHCPHGRPTIISFSEKELEKRFKRIG